MILISMNIKYFSQIVKCPLALSSVTRAKKCKIYHYLRVILNHLPYITTYFLTLATTVKLTLLHSHLLQRLNPTPQLPAAY